MHLLTVYTLLTLSLFTTTYHPTHNSRIMGMSYDIIPNKETKCENDFGDGLSYFFEQVEAYYETAEVEQVSRVLNIDLSVFQDINYNYEDKSDIENHWHDIDTFVALVDTFISKIKSNPDYYKQVFYNPNRDKNLDEEQRIWQIADTAERDKKLELLRSQPFYYYPPDRGLLSEGRLLKGLQTLRRTLECYKKSGVTKVRLEYT